MKNVLGIGNALVDVLKMVPDDSLVKNLGFAKGSMTLVDNELSRKLKEMTGSLDTTLASGGSVANTIHGLARLGMDAGYIGAIGRDEFGDFFESDMRGAGVNTYLLRKATDTGTALALVTPDSERTFATHLGAAIELSASDISSHLLTGYDFLYIEGYLITNRKLVEKACKSASEKGVKIAIDFASFNVVEAFRDDFQDIVKKYVDIIFANEEEARAFTGIDNPEESLRVLSEMCEIAVVKLGKNGSFIKRGEEIIKVDTITVKSKDTTGAGDLYAAGFLYGLCRSESLDRCGAYGSILAGNVIEVIGPKMPVDRWKAVMKSVNEVSREK